MDSGVSLWKYIRKKCRSRVRWIVNTQSPAYTNASPALGPLSVRGSELPPVLGPTTSAVSDGWSCDLDVTSPEVWLALIPEVIVGSLFACADGRDHQLHRLTLLAARYIL